MTGTAIDWAVWARDLARDHDDIAMIVHFEPRDGGETHRDASATHHIGVVMKDGGQTAWFAAGKGIDGMAWSTVPGRDALPRLLADERLRTPGVTVYVSFCDARALLFTYAAGRERIGGEALVDAPYRMLYPGAGERPAIEEFFLHWGEPE